MGDSVLHLFAAICGGLDWLELYGPLYEMGAVYGVLLLFYVFFTFFGVLNVIIGAFVDGAKKVAQQDREYLASIEIENKKRYMMNLRDFFHEADEDRSGVLTSQE